MVIRNVRDEGLGPKRRIKRRQDFLRIQDEGRKWRSRHFLLVVSEPETFPETADGSIPEPRIGITITKKVDKRAARRNRVKRRVREVFRRHRARFTRTADIVFIALTGSPELSFLQTVKELKYLLYAAELLPAQPGRGGQRPRQDYRDNRPPSSQVSEKNKK